MHITRSKPVDGFRFLVLSAIFLAVSAMTALSGCGGGGGGDGRPKTFTVRGTITPTAGAHIDGDVNDPEAPYRANDNYDQAQRIPNPVVVGGYVNEADTGPVGRSFAAGGLYHFCRHQF